MKSSISGHKPVVVVVVVVMVAVKVLLMFDEKLRTWGWSTIHCLRVFRHKEKRGTDQPMNKEPSYRDGDGGDCHVVDV